MVIGVLVHKVSWTAELFYGEGVPEASGVVTGVCKTAVVLTRFSGTGVVGMGVGGNVEPWIPQLFLNGLPDPIVWFMLVTRLWISLHDAMLSVHVNYHRSAL